MLGLFFRPYGHIFTAFELDNCHFDLVDWIIALVAWHVDDLVSDFHSLQDATEDGILSVKPRCVGYADEKLGGRTIGIGCSSSRDNSSPMSNAIELSRYAFLAGVAKAPLITRLSLTVRVATLYHEVRNDPVECRAVVEPYRNETIEIGNMLWCNVWEELDDHGAKGFSFLSNRDLVLRAFHTRRWWWHIAIGNRNY